MIQRLVSELPSEVPPLAASAAAALAAAQPRAALLRHLLHATALTVAHGFVMRCVRHHNYQDRSCVCTTGTGAEADAEAAGAVYDCDDW